MLVDKIDERPVNDNADEYEEGSEALASENPYDDTGDGGYGTGTLISAINKLPEKSSNNIFDIFLVNVATLIRNNTTKDRTEDEIIEKVFADMRDLTRCIVNYHENMSVMLKNPMLVYYLPEYGVLPKAFARPLTGNRLTVSTITQRLIKDDNLKVRKRIRGHDRHTTLLEVYAGGGMDLPYRYLIKELNSLYMMSSINTENILSHYLLISHAPLDYYLMLNYPRVMLLESFTGNFLAPKRLGYKVFGTNFIPFNKVTHVIFGDKHHVRPMAMRKNRALLTEMAKKQQWYIRTPTEIAKLVGASGQVPAQVLMNVRF